MAEIRKIDWDGVEREYRAGIRTLRSIGEEFGLTHGAINKRATRDGWERDLSAKIRAQAESLVSRDAVSSEVSKKNLLDTRLAEKTIVQANAEMQAGIIRAHRTDIGRARSVTQRHFEELESADGLELKEKAQIGKLLNESLKLQIGLERQAFGLADNAESDQPDGKFVRRIELVPLRRSVCA